MIYFLFFDAYIYRIMLLINVWLMICSFVTVFWNLLRINMGSSDFSGEAYVMRKVYIV